ncbi:hypothetical protein SAY87_030681 [Trapa incisa]|uniref:NAC domain-containing protein n=1 Tax=Trapa incisa TaxID=236973 RepID=A0AAN7QK78_9MYRT|nr:hypothetical protein SAY87_030681 [Trapa incisa]
MGWEEEGLEMEVATTKMSYCNKNTKMEEEQAEAEDDLPVKLPGFRFHPTDEELLSFYLKRKVDKKLVEVIKQIDIYKYDPWDLPKVSSIGEKEWYFFCMRGRKYRNSIRPNRVTGSGFWKATGIDKPIYAAKDPEECIGLKKSLVYYRGNAGKGTKTDWMMHEFRLPPANYNKDTASPALHYNMSITQEAEVWTLCRIFKRTPSHRKYTPGLHQPNAKSLENISPTNDYCSKTKTNSSFQSEYSFEKLMSFGDSAAHSMKESTIAAAGMGNAFVDERNSLYLANHFNPIAHPYQPSFSAPYLEHPGFWNLNGHSQLTNENNWDELRSVIERTIHTDSDGFDFT